MWISGKALLVYCLAAITAAPQGGKRVNPSPVAMPAEVALCEQGPEGDRVAILATGTKQLQYVTQPGGSVGSLAWSPDGRWLAFSEGGAVSLLDMDSQERRSVVPQAVEGMPCTRCFSSDSRYLATLLPNRIMLTELSGSSFVLDVPGKAEPVELLWSADARALLVLARTTDGRRDLLLVDVPGRRVLAARTTRCIHLLGWRQGNLLIEQEDDSGNEVGSLSDSGAFQPLRTDGIVGDEIYLGYLGRTDRLAFTIGREHSGDPVQLFLTTPGLNGASRWLPSTSFVGEMRFSRDGDWAVFIDRSRPELFDGTGGDLYISAVGNDAPVLLRKAVPGEVSYTVGAIRR
jgi:dipeptidyl aminopeptidase/acylaminoacyl peptidase